MKNETWVDHLNQWKRFLEQRMQSVTDDGERQKIKRQLTALERVRFGSVLNPNLLIEFINGAVENTHIMVDDYAFCLDMLNKSQKEAVMSVIANDSVLSLIQGPPGTGKTQVIAEICLQLYHNNPDVRILVCSETHVAVNNLITRISENNAEIRVVRIRDKDQNSDADSFTTKSISNEYVKWIYENCSDKAVADILAYSVANNEDKGLEKALALSANVVGMTCNRVGAYRFDDTTEMFDYVIIDEVCKATLPEILMPLTIAKKAILVGDPKQLPPVFCDEDISVIRSIDDCHLERYMYIDQLIKDSPNKRVLNTQYRMVDSIGNLISELFYLEEGLANGRNRDVKNSLIWVDYHPLHDWPECNNGTDDKPIIRNLDECNIIEELVKPVSSIIDQMNQLEKNDKKHSFVVIVPYKNQATELRRLLPGVNVETVDSVQGKEFDIVIFGITRTTGSYRFLADARRLNVALSRAKNQLIIVGNKEYAMRYPLLNKIIGRCTTLQYTGSIFPEKVETNPSLLTLVNC